MRTFILLLLIISQPLRANESYTQNSVDTASIHFAITSDSIEFIEKEVTIIDNSDFYKQSSSTDIKAFNNKSNQKKACINDTTFDFVLHFAIMGLLIFAYAGSSGYIR